MRHTFVTEGRNHTVNMLIARQMSFVTDLQALLIAQDQQVAAINNTSTYGLHQAEVLDVNLQVADNTVSSCSWPRDYPWEEGYFGLKCSYRSCTHCCPHTLLASML